MVASLGQPVGKYQAYIDGLRAVAVSAVVAFHAFPSRFHGGFVGVDIFFVISGYLITGKIIGSLQTNQFNLAGFYAARVRRIYPALVVVMLACCVGGWFVLYPEEYASLGEYTFAGAVFASNLALWRDAGYFDTASNFKPLLHLWSLGIEEQFYIFWPLLLMITARIGRSTLVTLAVFVASLLLCIHTTGVDKVAAFYSPFTRFWELLVGGLLAQYASTSMRPLSPRVTFFVREALATIGVIFLAYSISRFDGDMAFPGFRALYPTLGAAFIIMSGPRSWISRWVLANPLSVWIGLISYPLYLWHWPVLVFSRIVVSDGFTFTDTAIAIAISFLLAAATYQWVEKPIRHGRTRPRLRLAGLAAAMTVVAVMGIATYMTLGFPSRIGSMAEMTAQHVRTPATDRQCESFVGAQAGEYVYCRFNDAHSTETAALIGDSHAHALFPGFAEVAAKAGKNALLLANSGCPTLDGVTTGVNEEGKERCRQGTQKVLKFISGRPDIKTVLISTRGALYMTGNGFGRYQTHLFLPALHVDGSLSAPDQTFISGLRRTVDLLVRNGKEVRYFLENPEMDVNPQDCIGNLLYLRRNRSLSCESALSDVLARQNAYRQQVSAIKGLEVIDPLTILCPGQICQVFARGKLLYADSDHLSIDGSIYVSENLLPGRL